MLASALAALTVVPTLASYVFRRPVKARISPFLLPFEWSYRLLMSGALRCRWRHRFPPAHRKPPTVTAEPNNATVPNASIRRR